MSKVEFKNETSFEFGNGFEEGFTVVPNNILNNREISFKALGIYTQIVQYQNSKEHKIYMATLEKLKTENKSAIRSGMNELIEHGYIERITIRNDKGHMKGYHYIIHATPIEKTTLQPKSDYQTSDYQISDNRTHINKISNKENKKKENKEEEEVSLPSLYYKKYKLSKNNLPHINKLLDKYKNEFDLDVWEEIFINASGDNVDNKYKYVKTLIEDYISKGIKNIDDLNKKNADHKSANNPNISICKNKNNNAKDQANNKLNTQACPIL